MGAVPLSGWKVPVHVPPKTLFLLEQDWTLWTADANGTPKPVRAKALFDGEFRNYIESVIENEDGTVTRKYSEFRQLVDEIAARVGRVEYADEELKARLQQAEASWQITAEKIDQRVWLEDFAVFRNDLTTLEAIIKRQSTRITQTAAQIASKATRQEFEVVKRDQEYLSLLIKQEESERLQQADQIRDSVSQQLFDQNQTLTELVFSQVQQLADSIASTVGEFSPGGQLCELTESYTEPGAVGCTPLLSEVVAGDVIFVIPEGDYVPVEGTITADASEGEESVSVDFGAVELLPGSKVYISAAYAYSLFRQTAREFDFTINQIDDRTSGTVLGLTSGSGDDTTTISMSAALPVNLYVGDVVSLAGQRVAVESDRTTSDTTIAVGSPVDFVEGQEVVLAEVGGKGIVTRVNLSPSGVLIQGRLIQIDGDTVFSSGYGPADVAATARRRILVSVVGSVSASHNSVAWSSLYVVLGDGTVFEPGDGSSTGLSPGQTRYLFMDVLTGSVTSKSSPIGGGNDVLLASATTSAESGVSGTVVFQSGRSVISGNSIATGSVTASNMKALTITANEIAALTITGAKIAAGTLTADKFSAGVITTIADSVEPDVVTSILGNTVVLVRGTMTVTQNAVTDLNVQVRYGDGAQDFINTATGLTGLSANTRYIMYAKKEGITISARLVTESTVPASDETQVAAVITGNAASNNLGSYTLSSGQVAMAGNAIVAGSLSADLVKTGLLQSFNWSTTEGSQLNMATGEFKMGGSAAPKFGVTTAGLVTMTGANVSGTIHATSGRISGSMVVGNPADVHILLDGATGKIRSSNYAGEGIAGFEFDPTTGWLQAKQVFTGGLYVWGDSSLGFGGIVSVDQDDFSVKLAPEILGNPGKIGFYGATPVLKPTISGVSDSQKIDSIIAVLSNLGLANDGTS